MYSSILGLGLTLVPEYIHIKGVNPCQKWGRGLEIPIREQNLFWAEEVVYNEKNFKIAKKILKLGSINGIVVSNWMIPRDNINFWNRLWRPSEPSGRLLQSYHSKPCKVNVRLTCLAQAYYVYYVLVLIIHRASESRSETILSQTLKYDN